MAIRWSMPSPERFASTWPVRSHVLVAMPPLVLKDLPVSLSTKGGIATKTWDLTGQVLANLSGLGIEHLIAIGGDDTLSYAARLNDLGVKIIAIPKTMDNDVRNTEYCIGFSTAITRASDAIQRQR